MGYQTNSEALPAASVIVTGAASGIGEATVAACAAAGYAVGVFDIDGAAAHAVATAHGVHCTAFPADVTDADAVQRAVAAFLQNAPPLHGLVNNAGGGGGQKLAQMTLAQFEATIQLNLTSAFIVTAAAYPNLKANGGGSIVNIASLAATRISPVGGAAYSASKAGLAALTRQSAHEFAADRVRVNAVCPGPTRTKYTARSSRQDADFPLGRWVEPSDVSDAILFLLSDRAQMITGALLEVDGGVGLR